MACWTWLLETHEASCEQISNFVSPFVNFDTLKLAIIGVFTPQKWANAANQGVSLRIGSLAYVLVTWYSAPLFVRVYLPNLHNLNGCK